MPRIRPIRQVTLAALAVGVGVIAGLGAVVFRGLIAFFHNLLLLRSLSFSYNANLHTPASPWGALVILVPVVGAVVVTFLVRNFAPEAKGHGVPEVMDANYYQKGVIRPVVTVIKALASALSIGTGGSVGREGPIIQIGSAFGSLLGQLVRMPVWQRITLVAAGAGGGIAATFNTPIGGTLFAIELMVQEVSVRTLVPVAIATVTATYVGRLFFGPFPSFVIPALEGNYFHVTAPALVLPYLGLGILMGLASGAYIKSLYATEALFERRVPGGPYVRHMLGMLLVGVLMYVLFETTGRYYTEGIGYATIQDVLTGQLAGFWFLILLCGLKLLATCLTLGSGASGGIFSPSLFMGATLGGAYGVLLERLLPSLPVSPSAFAVVGMAGMVSGTTGAALAAIVMIFEMTLDYSVIVPMAATVAVSYGVRWLVSEETIYTEKLVARKHYVPKALRADFHHLERARDVMDTRVERVGVDTAVEDVLRRARENPDVHYILTEREGRVAGVIPAGGITKLDPPGTSETPVGEIAATRYVLVHEEMAFLDVLEAMQGERAGVALVVQGARVDRDAPVVGVIDRKGVTAGLEEVIQHYLS